MKRLSLAVVRTAVTVMFLSLCMVETSSGTEQVDAFTSASKKNHFSNTCLKGDALMKVIKNHDAAFVLSTTNPDNSPNAAVFMPGIVSENTLKFGLADNQSRKNIERTKKAVLTVYKLSYNKTGKNKHQGARLFLELVEDETVNKKSHTVFIMKIQRVMPLG